MGRETWGYHPAYPTRTIRRENDLPDRFLTRLKQPNAYIERYNRTVRHEWLDQHIIENLEEAQDFATQWLWTYNNDRSTDGHRLNHTRTKTENGRMNSTNAPR